MSSVDITTRQTFTHQQTRLTEGKKVHSPEGWKEWVTGTRMKEEAALADSIEVTIRPLTLQDVETFVRWRGGDDYKDQIVRKEVQEHLAGKRVLWVAETGGQLVGTVQFVPTHEDTDLADGKTTAYLQALEVREDCRRRGLGTRLVGAVERMSLERGFKRLTLMVEPDNKPAICLYSKLGFTVFKDSSELWRGKPLATLCMSKSLILNRNRCTANHASRRRLRRLGTVTRP